MQNPGKPSEKDLDLALCKGLMESRSFLQWFLSHTKFADRGPSLISCRADSPWGSHPFPTMNAETGATSLQNRQSETDVLLVLRAKDGATLGVHVENKIGTGSFTADQPEMYWHRANHWLNNPHYGNYSEFDTVLVAPAAFLATHPEQAACFGCRVSHEELARYIPLFGVRVDA